MWEGERERKNETTKIYICVTMSWVAFLGCLFHEKCLRRHHTRPRRANEWRRGRDGAAIVQVARLVALRPSKFVQHTLPAPVHIVNHFGGKQFNSMAFLSELHKCCCSRKMFTIHPQLDVINSSFVNWFYKLALPQFRFVVCGTVHFEIFSCFVR